MGACRALHSVSAGLEGKNISNAGYLISMEGGGWAEPKAKAVEISKLFSVIALFRFIGNKKKYCADKHCNMLQRWMHTWIRACLLMLHV